MIENDFNEVIRDWLVANRPQDTPPAMPIRAAQDKAKVARPFLVAICEDTRWQQEVLAFGTLVLRMSTREAPQDAIEAARWHQAFVKILKDPEGFEGLKFRFQQRGYWLRYLRAGEYDDRGAGRNGRMYEQRWKWCVQTAI